MSCWRRCAGAARAPAAALSAVLAVAALAAASPATGGELRGRLDLVDAKGRPASDVEPAKAVVYFQPAGARAALSGPHRTYEIVTRDKEFVPRVLAVPVGSSLRFPNADPILHNVFSVSPGNAFDLGLYRAGPGKTTRLDRPGIVRVFCNVHHSMVAYVLVLDTPYYAAPDAAGDFVLSGLPDGAGTLTVWHEQAEPSSLQVRVPAATPLIVRLEATRPRVPPHLNKLGRSYWRSRGDRYDR
jgi:plastocyanin